MAIPLAIAKSAIGALLQPTRQDLVAALGEMTAIYPSKKPLVILHRKMLADPAGRRLLRERPLINTKTIDMDLLRRMPHSSFGNAYYRFLHESNVSPDTRTPLQHLPTDDNYIDHLNSTIRSTRTVEGEQAYVLLRYRQIHDFLHTLTGVPITVAGELGLKWFEFYQFGLPMQLMAGLFGPARLLLGSDPKNQFNEFEVYWYWALQSAPNARFLLSVYFEDMFSMDLDQVRLELNLLPFSDKYLPSGKGYVGDIQFNSNTKR